MKSTLSRVSRSMGRISLAVILTGMFVFGSMLIMTGNESDAASKYKHHYKEHPKPGGGYKHGYPHYPRIHS